MDYDRNIIAKNILHLLDRNNVSQDDLASAIGTHQSRISECLSCKKDFTFPQIVMVANFFNVSIDSLLEQEKNYTIQIDSLSDICRILFSLSKEVGFTIVNEYVEEDTDFDMDGNEIEPRIYAGGLCISFNNNNVRDFLQEWKDAECISSLSGGDLLYQTWKNGILQKYEDYISEYGYKDKLSYQVDLYMKYYPNLDELPVSKRSLIEDFLKKHPKMKTNGAPLPFF